MKTTRSNSQITAEKKYGEKRKKQYRLPSIYLNDDEKKLALEAFELNGVSKKDTIVNALKVFVKCHKTANNKTL